MMSDYINVPMAATICSGVLSAKLIWFLTMSMLSLLTGSGRKALPATQGTVSADRGRK